ncbi:MAG TPA: hypothetical protein VFT22_14075 [Kofleriaceae bacterium]|nr:hypothetical protein [Kofleriaceae bacterium]
MPTAPAPTAPAPTLRIAILCVAAFVAANLVFYLLSGSYFDAHREIVAGVSQPSYSPAQMTHVRVTFGVFSGVVAVSALFGTLLPRVVGHLIPALLGAIDLIAGFVALARDLPSVLGMTLLVSGAVMPVLAVKSFRGSRAAWAFLVAMCGVFAVVELFGAPKIRGALDIGLWIAMILPGLNAVAVAALVSLRDEYIERTS